MDKNRDEQYDETTRQRDPFRLPVNILLISSVILLVLVVAIALLGIYPVLFILTIASGTFIGLLLCSYFDLGFEFEYIKSDITKCLIVAAVVVIPLYLLFLVRFELFPVRTFVILPVLFYWFAIKIAWLKLTTPEIFLTALCTISLTGLVAYFLSLLLEIFAAA